MEKRGNTVKLISEFNTAGNLEVYMPQLNGWYRVTSREFRSFNGKRRINNEDYEGPLFSYGTNNIVNPDNAEKDKIVSHNWVSKKRPGE